MEKIKAIVLYIPVLHEGYLRFLKKHGNTDFLFLPNEKLVKEFTPVAKEIRQINAKTMKMIIEASGLHKRVRILRSNNIAFPFVHYVITANDTISLGITKKYFPNAKKKVDAVFLRWDEKNVYSQKPVSYDKISTGSFDRKIMRQIIKESQKSSDWWRHVGAAIVKNKKLLLINHNQHLPSEHMPYTLGDPRDVIPAGKDNYLSTAIHAEQALIAEAAKKGISLMNTDIYTTVFPCPVCAKMIAQSGVKKCFFSSGHASLDGLNILKTAGVEIILVK